MIYVILINDHEIAVHLIGQILYELRSRPVRTAVRTDVDWQSRLRSSPVRRLRTGLDWSVQSSPRIFLDRSVQSRGVGLDGLDCCEHWFTYNLDFIKFVIISRNNNVYYRQLTGVHVVPETRIRLYIGYCSNQMTVYLPIYGKLYPIIIYATKMINLV